MSSVRKNISIGFWLWLYILLLAVPLGVGLFFWYGYISTMPIATYAVFAIATAIVAVLTYFFVIGWAAKKATRRGIASVFIIIPFALVIIAAVLLSITIPVVAQTETFTTKQITYVGSNDPQGNNLGSSSVVQVSAFGLVDTYAKDNAKFTTSISTSAGLQANVYTLPDSVSSVGYSSPTAVIPPKSSEVLAYEQQVGKVLIPVVVKYYEPTTDTAGSITGYQSPNPPNTNPGGYWNEGVYLDPSGKTHWELWKESITKTETMNGITSGYVPNVGWITLSELSISGKSTKATISLLNLVVSVVRGVIW